MSLIRTAITIAAIILGTSGAQAGLWQIISYQGEHVVIYSAGSADADRAVVLVHDWFGLTEQTQAAVDHLADLGYRAAAVNLYSEDAVDTHADAWALMQALDAEAAASAIDGAIDYISQGAPNMAIMGFSMGVPHAIAAARRNSDRVSAVAVWYGDTNQAYGDAGVLGVPILGIYGELDGNATEQAAALEAGIGADDGDVEVFVYPDVGHAFAQPLFNGGDNYNETATAMSWALTEEFFARRMSQ